ncbi:MAG: FtsX-like permease family protein [Caldilineaceae bacterium]
MLTRLRLRKIGRDFWNFKTRTTLVVLTIAIGAFAVGTIARTWVILSRELAQEYANVNPAGIILWTNGLFHDDLVRSIRKMPEVTAAEGRYRTNVQVQVAADEWQLLQLNTLGDFHDLQVDRITPEHGAWPPPERSILLERSSLHMIMPGLMPAEATASPLLIELANGKRRTLTLSGLAYDLVQFPTQFSGIPYGYISQETLERLTGTRGYNRLTVVATTKRTDVAHLQEVADQVSDKVAAYGLRVGGRQIPQPGVHPLNSLIQPALYILAAFSLFSLLLSAVLVFNTMSEIMVRQVRQIGMMKAIGARRRDLMAIYLGLVLAFGLLAMLIALPLATVAAQGFARFMAGQLNFDIHNFSLPGWIYGLDLLLGCGLPVLVAWFPIMHGTRVTVHEAMQFTGATLAQPEKGRFAHFLGRLRGLPTPLLYPLRNVFRHKIRLALTLLTLTAAGAIFVIVLSIQAALLNTIDDVSGYWRQDIMLYMRSARVEAAEQAALGVPGVVYAEGERLATGAVRLLNDDRESNTKITLFGVLPGSRFIRPTLLRGRWLLPADENAIVLNVDLLAAEPDLTVGKSVSLRIGDRVAPWRVVGIVTGQVIGGGGLMDPIGYTNYDYLAQTMGNAGRTGRLLIETADHTPQNQAAVARALERHFRAVGLQINLTELNTQIRTGLENVFGILVSLLIIITVLLALAGGLGLMGTVSHSVLERTKEFAIIRTVGGSDRMVAQLVIVEGIVIGLLSWLLSILLAVPGSRWLSDQVGLIFLKAPLSYVFPTQGILLWLGAVMVLSTLASVLPAHGAAQLSVREALAYE